MPAVAPKLPIHDCICLSVAPQSFGNKVISVTIRHRFQSHTQIIGAVGLASGCRNLGGRTLGVYLFCPSPTAGATRRRQTTLSGIPLRLCVCRIIGQALISYDGALMHLIAHRPRSKTGLSIATRNAHTHSYDEVL